MAVVSLFWTPHDPTRINIRHRLAGPSLEHWLGADQFGRDILSIIMAGAQNSIMVGVVAVGIGMSFGVALGLIASSNRGWVEELIMRLCDFMYAFPAILLAILLVATLGSGAINAMVAIGIFAIPTFARLSRANANAIWSREFVLAARASGKGTAQITVEHILPNIMSVIVVQATIEFALAILAEAALSYLGIGSQPPTPSWGRMLSEVQTLGISKSLARCLSGGSHRISRAGPQPAGRRFAGLIRPPSGKETMTLLAVEDLTVTLDTIHGLGHAVRNLSFELMPGNTLGIVGESGCGKSMTALSILGLLPENAVTTGSIYFDHRNLLTCSDQELCQIRGNRISMIFQEPMTSLNPVHTIGQQIIEIMTLHRGISKTEAKTEAIRLLDMVGIRDPKTRFSQYPHQLSGGQRQRVMIAIALANEPDLLIADEPTTAVDVTIQKQILKLIRSLVNELGMALILISHDLGVIANMVDQIIVMYGGTAVETGAASQIFLMSHTPIPKA